MAAISDPFLRAQLQERRKALDVALESLSSDATLIRLLREVDSALERMNQGTYGLCETCHESIEKDRLITDPLVRFCLDHLSTEQQRALEEDLVEASRIQRALLPPRNIRLDGWQVHYHYEPAGLVSGDYCDLILPDNRAGEFFFLLGDVSGKGVAASMLMTHLHAMFRSLTSVGLSLDKSLAMANRLFCESTAAGQFATLVCGRASPSGEVEISSAGHCPALLVQKDRVAEFGATGLPLGIFRNGEYSTKKIQMQPSDTLVLYSDGVSEARDASGTEYGVSRLARFVGEHHEQSPDALTTTCLKELEAHSGGASKTDDLTILVLRRAT